MDARNGDPVWSTLDRCRWTAARLKLARDAGDLVAELAYQIRLDQLLDRLHAENTVPDERTADGTRTT